MAYLINKDCSGLENKGEYYLLREDIQATGRLVINLDKPLKIEGKVVAEEGILCADSLRITEAKKIGGNVDVQGTFICTGWLHADRVNVDELFISGSVFCNKLNVKKSINYLGKDNEPRSFFGNQWSFWCAQVHAKKVEVGGEIRCDKVDAELVWADTINAKEVWMKGDMKCRVFNVRSSVFQKGSLFIQEQTGVGVDKIVCWVGSILAQGTLSAKTHLSANNIQARVLVPQQATQIACSRALKVEKITPAKDNWPSWGIECQHWQGSASDAHTYQDRIQIKPRLKGRHTDARSSANGGRGSRTE